MNDIWLASYPRSGNTYLRTILWHCFGLHSASVYPDDLGGHKRLEEYVGHIEHGPDGKVRFPDAGLRLMKTHEYPPNNNPAIYVVRDGRAACISLWKFYHCELPLDVFVEGRHRFGIWSDHVRAWAPFERPHTLLLKYEDMVSDLRGTLDRISRYLNMAILRNRVPGRETIAGIDGRWVKTGSDWRSEIPEEYLERFTELNGDMLERLGYA